MTFKDGQVGRVGTTFSSWIGILYHNQSLVNFLLKYQNHHHLVTSIRLIFKMCIFMKPYLYFECNMLTCFNLAEALTDAAYRK